MVAGDAALLECGDADAEVLSRVLSCLVHVEETGTVFRQSGLLEAWQAEPGCEASDRCAEPGRRSAVAHRRRAAVHGLSDALTGCCAAAAAASRGFHLAAARGPPVAALSGPRWRSWEARRYPDRPPPQLLVSWRAAGRQRPGGGTTKPDLKETYPLIPKLYEWLLGKAPRSRTDYDAAKNKPRLAAIGDPRAQRALGDGLSAAGSGGWCRRWR